MATAVEQIVAKRVVNKIEEGFAEPAAALIVITPRGSKVTLDVLIAKNRHMESVAVPFSGLI